MYGISVYSLAPPFSLIISIVLFLGVTFIGFKVINNNKIGILFERYNYKNFFSPLVGAYLLIFFIYPFLSLGIFDKKIFIIISSIIFILGLIFIFFSYKEI